VPCVFWEVLDEIANAITVRVVYGSIYNRGLPWKQSRRKEEPEPRQEDEHIAAKERGERAQSGHFS